MTAALTWISWTLSTLADILGTSFALVVLLLMAGLLGRALWLDIFRPRWLDFLFYVSTQARNVRAYFRKDRTR